MPVDKILHLLAGFIIASLLAPFIGALLAITTAAVVGLLKEAYDSTGRGNVEFGDFIVTAAGGGIAVAMHLVLQLIFSATDLSKTL